MGEGGKEEKDDGKSIETLEGEKKKEKDHTPSKVVIRRLPPSLTPEDFLNHVSPLPDYDFFYFVKADMSLESNAFTRAYINFLAPDDVFIFRDKFDGYVFIDSKGGEYPAIVEFAPFQKVPKKKPKKIDLKNGIIEQDSDYKRFLELLATPAEAAAVSLDAMVGEVEAREATAGKPGISKKTTPLLDYLKKRREERKYNIAKLKEDRRRGGIRDRDLDRDLDRKRPSKEDLDKRRAEKERLRDRDRDRDRRRDRNKDRLRDRDRDRLRDRDRDRDRDKRKDYSKPDKYKDDRYYEEKRYGKNTDDDAPPKKPIMLLKHSDRDSSSRDDISGKGDDVKSTPSYDRDKRRESSDYSKSEDNSGKRYGDKWADDKGYDDDRPRFKDKGRDDRDKRKGNKDWGYDDRDKGKGYYGGDRDRDRGKRGKDQGYDDRGKKGKDWDYDDKYRDKKKDKEWVYDDRDREKRDYGGRSYDDDKKRSDRGKYRDDRFSDKDRRGGDRAERYSDKDRDDKYSEKDRERGSKYSDRDRDRYKDRGDKHGYSSKDKYRDEKGGGDRYKDDRRGGTTSRYDDRKGGGDGWKKKDSDYEKKPSRYDKEKPYEKGRIDSMRQKAKDDYKSDVKKEKISSREGGSDETRHEREKPKEDERQHKSMSDRAEASVAKARDDGGDHKGDSGPDADDKKKKRKERPERQIYIPRKALERQRQASPLQSSDKPDKPS